MGHHNPTPLQQYDRERFAVKVEAHVAERTRFGEPPGPTPEEVGHWVNVHNLESDLGRALKKLDRASTRHFHYDAAKAIRNMRLLLDDLESEVALLTKQYEEARDGLGTLEEEG